MCNDAISDDVNDDDKNFYNGFGDWGHTSRNTERSILTDLNKYRFDNDIKNRADVVYNKIIYQVRRGRKRLQLLFYCVYCAHLELERDVDPIELGAVFGLKQGEVQKCYSLFSPLQTDYHPPSKNTSPLTYLPGYCDRLKLSQEAIEDIKKISSDILMKDPTLYQENPQTVASGLLRYYVSTNGIILDNPSELSKLTSRSTVTIENMYKRISKIDNS